MTALDLLNDAILAMVDLHDHCYVDENDQNAIVPPDVFRRFVDAHARLLYEREKL